MGILKILDVLIFGLIRPSRGRRWTSARSAGVTSVAILLMCAATCILLGAAGDDAAFAVAFCLAGASVISWTVAAWACEEERRKYVRGNRGGPMPRA